MTTEDGTLLIQQPYGAFVCNRSLNRYDVYGGSVFGILSSSETYAAESDWSTASAGRFPGIPAKFVARDIALLLEDLHRNKYVSEPSIRL